MSKLHFNKVTVLGVGLIGASFAISLKQKGLCREIVGFGRNKNNLDKAKGRGIIDSYELDPATACDGSDLIVFATPVGSFLNLVEISSSSFKKGSLVTDVGSVKGDLVFEMEKNMPSDVSYVGSHPIAGSEQSGIDISHGELFRDALCIITPTEKSHKESVSLISGLWDTLGANVITMDPQKHDRIYAALSHLPHILAYSLVNTVANIDTSFLEFSGQGFKDVTRIALSSQELWRDICLLNKDNIIDMIAAFQQNLTTLSQYLRASDSASLEREFKKARTLREGIGQS